MDGWQTNPEVVAQFKRDGYLLIKGGYTSGEVEKCVSELKVSRVGHVRSVFLFFKKKLFIQIILILFLFFIFLLND